MPPCCRGWRLAVRFDYAYLLPFEDKYAGVVDFDYVLAVAALDSGKSDRATLAFERVLAVNPNFAGARLDMARAYFQLGDADRAKLEFLAVRDLNPPAQAQAVITQYLDAIDRIERAKKRSLRAYVELQIGNDTNVNNSGSQSTIAVPALGGLTFTLNPTNLKRGDSFKALGAGVDFGYQFRPDLGVFAGADFRQRMNFTQDTFDNGSMDLRGGVSIGESSNQVHIAGQSGRYTLDNELSRRAEGKGYRLRRLAINTGGFVPPRPIMARTLASAQAAEVVAPQFEGGMSQVTVTASGTVEIE